MTATEIKALFQQLIQTSKICCFCYFRISFLRNVEIDRDRILVFAAVAADFLIDELKKRRAGLAQLPVFSDSGQIDFYKFFAVHFLFFDKAERPRPITSPVLGAIIYAPPTFAIFFDWTRTAGRRLGTGSRHTPDDSGASFVPFRRGFLVIRVPFFSLFLGSLVPKT